MVSSACLLVEGCASSSRPEVIIHEDPKGSVTLERTADRSFQAAHPVSLSPTLIARVLRGVRVDDPRGTIQTLLLGSTKPGRAFSDEDIGFLGPLLAEALSRALPTQQARFRVIHPAHAYAYSGGGGAGVGSSKPVTPTQGFATTEGTLYAHGLSLYLTLTQYHYIPERPDTINMPNRRLPDTTGLDQREVSFFPEVARRPDALRQSRFFGGPHATTLVIDYELLAKLPESKLEPSPVATARPEASATLESSASMQSTAERKAQAPDELRSLKELIIKKDLELDALKEELRALRRQSGNRESGPSRSKPKKKPLPRTQGAAP